MRRAVVPLLAVAVIAVVVTGLLQASGGGEKEPRLPPFDITQALRELEGAPAPLASLHAQQSRLLGGGTKAYEARLEDLRGFPVVVNKWGSWCDPCREEFPLFQRAAVEYGKRVAFLGINTLDNEGAARAFLREMPLPFPSYVDPRGVVSEAAGAGGGVPITLFIGRDGKTAFAHLGQYRSLADLREDLRRYLRVP